MKDTLHCSVEKQLAMTLYILGHDMRMRTLVRCFQISSETISRYFNHVAVECLMEDYIKYLILTVPSQRVLTDSIHGLRYIMLVKLPHLDFDDNKIICVITLLIRLKKRSYRH